MQIMPNDHNPNLKYGFFLISCKSLGAAFGRCSRSTLVERNALSKVCNVKLAKATWNAKLD